MVTINTDYYKKRNSTVLTDEEQAVSYYVFKKHQLIDENCDFEDYSNLIEEDSRYFIKYNFSEYRSSILRWYPFNPNTTVLEINAGYGALTGALCDRCEKVKITVDSMIKANIIADRYSKRDNLEIIVGEWNDISFYEKFDYIICFEQLEYLDNEYDNEEVVLYINKLRSLLSDNGVLIIECENKYGARYLSGARETHSGVPFDSLAGYPQRRCGHGYHRAELERILVASEFANWKFYYPFPDYIAPRAVFTDVGIPESNIIERMAVHYKDNDTMVADDKKIMMDVVENGVYHFACNHFIVEVTDNKNGISDIGLLYLTGYRSREKAFATIIHESENGRYVQKRCLYNTGYEYAARLVQLNEKIKNKGLSVIHQEFKEDSIYMNYVTYPTVLKELLKRVEEKDVQGIVQIFDMFWDDIQKSSEFVQESNIPRGYEDMGPILKMGFWEMVPINSFWKNGQIMYYDQEHEMENCPALYILDRVIRITFGLIPKIQKLICIDEVYSRFKISKRMQNVFRRIELEMIVKENPHSVFYRNDLLVEKMKKNREILRKQ